MEELIGFLQSSDYFEAPASTKYHGNHPGGLAQHCFNVYNLLKEKNERFKLGLPDETVIIASLLHDMCKVNFYKVEQRWRKDDRGKWESYDTYGCDDTFPLGHGEKSVIMLQHFLKLTKVEILMIRWHMALTEGKDAQMHINNAFKMLPAISALHSADLESSYLLENHVEV
jgi:HD superfamily phosphohydrolase YqeK